MEKRGVRMNAWVLRSDIETVILPAVNRIWRPAGIRFQLTAIHVPKALYTSQRDAVLSYVLGPQRDRKGRSDPGRIRMLKHFIDPGLEVPHEIAIYLLPYLGENSHGAASQRQRRVLVGQWSDKASAGQQPPERFRLTEPGGVARGSMSRTIAHELGHILGLPHAPPNKRRLFGLLMGTGKPGYRLTREEITAARQAAKALLQQTGAIAGSR